MGPYLCHTTTILALFFYLATCAPGISEHQIERSIAPDVSLESHASPPSNTNHTLSLAWPRHSYTLTLVDGYFLVVYTVTPYIRLPLPLVSSLRAFIHSFADNLENAYPPPALAPKRAGQSEYDVRESFTEWQIKESLPLPATAAPAKVVIAALLKLSLEVKKFGPPADLNAIIFGGGKTVFKMEKPSNMVTLEITPIRKGEGEGAAVDDTPAVVNTS
ncbi:MAG: hypothetical protein Q9181_002248 [Wetmoreana brouardii]